MYSISYHNKKEIGVYLMHWNSSDALWILKLKSDKIYYKEIEFSLELVIGYIILHVYALCVG